VGDLDGSASNQGTKWRATVAVTIHDNASPDHQPASGAIVTGSWSGGFTGTFSGTTGSNGQCTFTSGQISKSASQVTFTITSVQHASLSYIDTQNHDPDGDSNGTSITVNKP
jgi:serine protease AprX